jgi:hypothetical protein
MKAESTPSHKPSTGGGVTGDIPGGVGALSSNTSMDASTTQALAAIATSEKDGAALNAASAQLNSMQAAWAATGKATEALKGAVTGQ